jgi:hypothetical protein
MATEELLDYQPQSVSRRRLDLVALAGIVASEQSAEPREHRVTVQSGAWHTLASNSVSRGLRQASGPGRARTLFEAAQIEPTHLTPVAMTAAALAALRTGDMQPWRMRAESVHHDPRAIPASTRRES